MTTNANAETLETPGTTANGAAPHWHPALAPPPDRLAEPELSAFRHFQSRIAEAQERLVQANEAWAAFAPVIAARYDLSREDRVHADGTITRGEGG